LVELSSPSYSGYTHVLSISTKKLKATELNIKVLDQLPDWISASSSVNDEDIKSNSDEQKKTFGLSYLVNGAFNAFNPEGAGIIGEIKIKIEK
ncbi:hypothetical protein DBR11_14345, partial [Pedobacter sp. HMWF019]|uniref:hypothetical protein n=1 Tax=Pedobacter sp. HMWF019 TaxID=2056856 RepID=UPI000D40D298